MDMRSELKAGNKTMISRALYRQMTEAFEKKKQVILFLNRRGYSTFISCRECGMVLRCPDCGISLTYHKEENRAVCHYCGHNEPLPSVSPQCGSAYIRTLARERRKWKRRLWRCFPRRGQNGWIWMSRREKEALTDFKRFKKGTIDILIGTQLVAKGLDFRNVALVGIISADVTLNILIFGLRSERFS